MYYLIPLLLSGCSLNPSLFGKGSLDKIVDEAIKRAPSPFIDVQSPPPEKIIDWPELAALAAMGLGSIGHRYWYHRRKKSILG